ncbi:IclR family transcriptional regulator [Halobaculum litoreum]|uniref:IclR family transcriptional regulator n=1 Tax=Halobaculum litoreum TaxID=3031998 RepID=UPI0024C42E77|nr:IclR family transcriptional regulator [Halobaculum sp. DT92]
MAGGAGGTIATDETLFALLDALHAEGEAGVSALAARLELSKSAVHKHLKTLEQHGYVHNTDGTYRLGLKFLEYGGKVRDASRIYDLGRRKVSELAAEIDELVILSVREFDAGVFLYRENDQYNLKETIPLGNRFHLHQNGAGKAMLAELPDAEIDRIIGEGLPGSTPRTITDGAALWDEIEIIRDRGFAVNRGERDPEVSAISAAVTDPTTDTVGAISVSLPTNVAAQEEFMESYPEKITQTASRLSLQLRHG